MEYFIKSSALTALLFLFYHFLLKNETFFKINRIYFLISILVIICLPLIEIPIYINPIVIDKNPISLNTLVSSINDSSLQQNTIDWLQTGFILYTVGILFFGLRFVIQLISLNKLLKSKDKIREDNFNYIETDKKISPFSFFNNIVFNKNEYDQKELEQIINHEKAHANQWHSIDVIITHLLLIFQWYNPFAWLLKNAIHQNLEFLADEQAQQQSETPSFYQRTLLKASTNNSCTPLTNNFYNSLIKKRITMLHKNRSHKNKQWKYAIIAPIILAFVFAFNTKEVIAQEKVKFLKQRYDSHIEIITKDFQKKDFESLKNRIAKKGITFNYSNLKYNEKNEIIKLTLKLKNKNGKASATWERKNTPIPSIKVGEVNGQVIASSSFSSNDIISKEIKEELEKVDKKINTSEIKLHYKTKKRKNKEFHEVIELKGDDSFAVMSDGHIKHVIKKRKDKDGETHEIIIEEIKHEDGDKDRNIKTITVKEKDNDHEIHIKKNNYLFISDTDEKDLLFIIDEKETTKEQLKELDPNKIASMTVLKGNAATEKYGDKAKDGVIIIKTKKD